MAKVHLDRMRRKYDWTGERYSELTNKIFENNRENVSRAISRKTDQEFKKMNYKIKDKPKRFVLPDVTKKRNVFALKAAEKGKRLTDNLRDGMTKDLRQTLAYKPTGRAEFLITTGKKAGQIKPEVIEKLETKLRNRFENYTKRDKKFGMPKNIHMIANEEIRANVSLMRDEYKNAFLEKNPDVVSMKKWIHNLNLVKEPRKAHMRLEKRKAIPDSKDFVYKNKDGVTFRTPYPHHEILPIGEKAGCQCDVQYFFERQTGG